MTVRVNLSGLRTISEALNEAISRGSGRAAHMIADLAAQLAPEKTGALKRSIHVEPGASPSEWSVVTDVPYAAFVEYGTADSEAQPFLTPAAEQIDVELEIRREIQRALSETRRR
jgi:HK97 gp10 family phage protein